LYINEMNSKEYSLDNSFVRFSNKEQFLENEFYPFCKNQIHSFDI